MDEFVKSAILGCLEKDPKKRSSAKQLKKMFDKKFKK